MAEPILPSDIAALKQGDNVVRDKLILDHMDMAHKIASRFSRMYPYLYDDLRSEAIWLLVMTIERAKTHLVDDDLPNYVAHSILHMLRRYVKYNRLPTTPSEVVEPSYSDETVRNFFETIDDIIHGDDILKEIVARRIQGETFASIADALDLSPGTVSRKFKGVKRKYFNDLHRRKSQSS